MEDDCGCDGIENLPMIYPLCCNKHAKESRHYTSEQFKEVINKIIIVPIKE